MKRSIPTPYLVFGFLALLWGMTFLFNKIAGGVVSPMQIVMVRVVIGFLPVLAFALSRKVLRWEHVRYIHHFVVMSLMAATVYYFAFAKGISLLPTSTAGMLSGAIPLFSFVGAAIFLRSEPVNFRSITGLLIGFGGVIVIARPWDANIASNDLTGVLYIAFGSACVGLSFVYARKFLSPLGISPIALCTYQLGLSSLTAMAIGDFDGLEMIFTDWKAAGSLFIGLGLLGTGMAFMCYYYLVEQLGAIKTSSVTYIPPVIGLLTGVLILGETISMTDIIATAAILSGTLVMQSSRTPAATAQSAKTTSDCSITAAKQCDQT
ncbi:DMT family transporter [Thalassospira lucentensis]|uniref:EamA family transporter n=1 Tax=Thalassospira lucentensis TaxID=168935 RepID=A0A358HU72_9PROT|nr:DMT family transporter [Thalassospira lucentensis]HBU98701.1 EamA family transporter [Thalassospira lucentensis]HCW68869.1 EamA family transporter [Thalassospira lucentensis]